MNWELILADTGRNGYGIPPILMNRQACYDVSFVLIREVMMRICYVALVAVAILVSGTAKADNIADCEMAIAKHDLPSAQVYARRVLVFGRTDTAEQRSRALSCLNSAFDETYVFDDAGGRYITEEQDIARRRKNAEAIIAPLQAAVTEHNENVRKADLANKVADACKRLYKSDPDQTIANQVCLGIFLETGLPE